MRRLIKKLNNTSGIVLISAYFLVASLLTIISTYFISSVNDFKLMERRFDRLQAGYSAEAGIERAIQYYILDQDNQSAFTDINVCATSPVESPLNLLDFGNNNIELANDPQPFTVSRWRDCTDKNGHPVYWLRSYGTHKNIKRESRVSLQLQPNPDLLTWQTCEGVCA